MNKLLAGLLILSVLLASRARGPGGDEILNGSRLGFHLLEQVPSSAGTEAYFSGKSLLSVAQLEVAPALTSSAHCVNSCRSPGFSLI